MLEETGIECEIEGVQEIDDRIYLDEDGKVEVHTVIIRLLARYVSGKAKGSSDAADAGWFAVDELDQLEMPDRLHKVVSQAFV